MTYNCTLRHRAVTIAVVKQCVVIIEECMKRAGGGQHISSVFLLYQLSSSYF